MALDNFMAARSRANQQSPLFEIKLASPPRSSLSLTSPLRASAFFRPKSFSDSVEIGEAIQLHRRVQQRIISAQPMGLPHVHLGKDVVVQDIIVTSVQRTKKSDVITFGRERVHSPISGHAAFSLKPTK